MARKSSLLAAAIALLALSLPALAHAAPEITRIPGVTAKLGESISETWSDITLTTSGGLGAITCEKLNLGAVVSRNNGAEFETLGSGKFTSASCKNETRAATVTKFEYGLRSTGAGKVALSFSTVIDIGALECTYVGTNVAGTYAAGGDTLKFSEATGVSSSPPSLCGPTATLDGEDTLEVSGGALALD